MASETGFSFEGFTSLGKNLEKGLYREALMEKLLDELKSLACKKGLKGSDGKYIHLPVQKLVEIYLPWFQKFYLGYINEVKEKRAEEGVVKTPPVLDAKIEIKLYVEKHDTRDKPVPISLETYLDLEKDGALGSSIWLSGILNPIVNVFDLEKRLRYRILEEKEVEALKWWK